MSGLELIALGVKLFTAKPWSTEELEAMAEVEVARAAEACLDCAEAMVGG